MKIIVDADACPKALKETLYRVSERRSLAVVLVANQGMWIPQSPLINKVLVSNGFDAADDRVVELAEPGDLVITADIPLAGRAVKKGCHALSHRGELHTERNIGQRLATRDLLAELRSGGVELGGPAPFNDKDRQNFANQLENFLARHLKSGGGVG